MRLIDAEKLTDTIENTDWYHVGTNGKLWHGANSETDTPLFKAYDVFDALENAPTVDAVVLPCKMGDVVWGIKTFNRGMEPRQGIVNQMYFGEDMRLCICVKNTCRGEWGKAVFATKEEAMAEIERRKYGN